MFHIPQHYHNLSLRLSYVLDDIGVNEKMVEMMQSCASLADTLVSLSAGNSRETVGSQSEGTTTIGLKSDKDILESHPVYSAIQDSAEWKPPCSDALLMIQDDKIPPGYCHLECLPPYLSHPIREDLYKHYCIDADGRILLQNTAFDNFYSKGVKNGPAKKREGLPGLSSVDAVVGVFCKSWPIQARDWLQRSLGKWPSVKMKRNIENSGCFVVPVGSKVTQNEHLEWRISTTRAEKCLMLNLNITQIRCFVLLKMICKTYLQDPVSSYMCKTVLLRCIEKMHHNMWQEHNLLICLTVCLKALHISIMHKSCPHYFIPGNNLMARQFFPRVKDKLLKSLHEILESKVDALFGIQIDDLGERLKIKMNPLRQCVQSEHIKSANVIICEIAGNLILAIAKCCVNVCTKTILVIGYNIIKNPLTFSEKLRKVILSFLKLFNNGTSIERKALQLLLPFLFSRLGLILSSVNIGENQSLSPEALGWLSAGLNSDVSSGRLKLASVLYCAGNMLWAELILKETERLHRLDFVQSVCKCYQFSITTLNPEFCRVCSMENEKAINSACAHCVEFLRAEMNCIPHEMQYELFRSTEAERLHRDEDDFWMDTAVVDPLPYLYFLQYKTYGNLQRNDDQQRALKHLASTIKPDENFGHRETTLNLLGQCMEQEKRLNDALVCYTKSLKVRERNNIAWIHICRLLANCLRNQKLSTRADPK